MFVKVSANGKNHLLKVANYEYKTLATTIEEQLQISDVKFFTSDNIQICESDIQDYLTQYISDFNFVLYLNEPLQSQQITPIPAQRIIPLPETYALESFDVNTTAFSLLENFDTVEELRTFIETNHPIILQNFKTAGKLTNLDRVNISKSIIKHLLRDPNKALPTSELEKLSTFLTEIFKGEIAATFYQRYCQGRHASGKLHDAYNNYRHTLAKAGIITRRTKSKSATPSCEVQIDLDKDNLQKDFIEQLSSQIDVTLLLNDQWFKSYEHRQKLLQTELSTVDYIKKFPALEQVNGFKLLNADIITKYEKELDLNFPEDFLKLILSKAKGKKDTSITHIVKLIENETEEVNKKLVSLMLLPYLLPVSNKKGKGGVRRPSKIEVAETFFVHYFTCAEADSGCRNFNKKISDTKLEIQPSLTFVGSPVTQTWVTVGHVKYVFDDIADGVKSCMATYLSLNIKYPKNSEKIWTLLQKFVFRISTPYDVVDATLRTLANDLNLH